MLANQLLCAQIKKAGPVISDYGKVWNVDKLDYPTDSGRVYKAVFDVMKSPDSHEQLNPSIETVARYLNMHVRSGVAREQIYAAIVIHNEASKDIMTPEAYREKYGVTNPNHDLIQDLALAGVDIIFCGQSSLSRNIPKHSAMPEVRVALSAMTALIQLQDEGYRLIKF
ncbi:MAG: DsrE family protein [Flavobacteriaceae bacterium]